jgi:hypothetical protein
MADNDVKTPELVTDGTAAAPSEDTALATRGETALGEALDWVGTETEEVALAAEDMKMPRLAIAQGLSPQLQEQTAEFIEGLKLGQMFNSLKQTIYGKGPMEFAIAKRLGSRWMEFDENRKLVDPHVDPHDKARTSWRVVDGKRKPPIATQFYDYVIVLLENMEPIALSCARTNVGPAKSLNGLIQLREPVLLPGGRRIKLPEFGMKFTVSVAQKPVPDKPNSYYGLFVFKQAGNLVNDPERAKLMKKFAEEFSVRDVEIDREAADEAVGDDTSFEYGANAAAPAGAGEM